MTLEDEDPFLATFGFDGPVLRQARIFDEAFASGDIVRH
jgi:hypothetical protein